MEQEIYQIVLQAKGEAEADRLAQKAAELEKRLADLRAQQAAGTIAQDAYLKSMRETGLEKAQLVRQINSVTKAYRDLDQGLDVLARKQSAAAGAASGGNMQNTQMNLLKLGYLLDDLQYVGEQGFRPIINNLMAIEPRLGIAILLFDQLYRNASKLGDYFGLGHTKTQAEEMDELSKKTEKTAEETAKLLKYERERANVKAQQEGQPANVSAMTAEVNKIIGEFGRDKLVSAMMGMDPARFANLPENAANVAKADALERSIRRRTSNGALSDDWEVQAKRDELAKVRAEIDAKSREKAGEQLGAIASNPGLLAGFINRLTASPNALGAGGMGVIQKLMAAQPEFKEAQQENEKIAGRADRRKAARMEAQRQKDEDDDYEWAKLQDEIGRRRAARMKREQVEGRQRQQEGDQQNWNNAPLMGTGGALQQMMLNTLRLGGNPNAIAGQAMAGMMAQRGVNVQDARRMVDDASFQARMERSKELLDRALPSDIRGSQVIAASSLANQIQSSITNKDDPRRMVNEQIKGNYLLQMILQETRRRQGVVFR